MDKFSELKRLAEKCPVQHFEPFIGRAGGRGTQAIFNAETKGEVITWSGFDSSDVASRTGREAIARFVAAADPETVLALLAELEAKTKHIADMEHVVAAAKCDDELWDAMAHRLKTLEAKLATPVRLPGSFYPDGDIDCPLVVELDEAVEAIHAAGFTVEGDA